MQEANQLERLGMLLAGNLAIAYVGFFVAFAGLEAAFSKGRDPGSSAHGRLIVNFSLPIASGLIALIIPFGVTTSAYFAEQRQWGLFHQIDAPALIVLIAAMLSRTGLGYLVHRLSHAVPWLWRLHKVHHCDPHVDISLSLLPRPIQERPFSIVNRDRGPGIFKNWHGDDVAWVFGVLGAGQPHHAGAVAALRIGHLGPPGGVDTERPDDPVVRALDRL